MSFDHEKEHYDKIQKTSLFMPFGIYSTDRKATSRASETLIGKNNERAAFIRRLLNSGKGGAYLITGQRGAGKTSFVDCCLDIYEQDTVQRLKNSTLAKNMLDIMFSLFFIASLLLLPLLYAAVVAYSDLHGALQFFASMPLVVLLVVLWRIASVSVRDSLRFWVSSEQVSKQYRRQIHQFLTFVITVLLFCFVLWCFSRVGFLAFIGYLCLTLCIAFLFFGLLRKANGPSDRLVFIATFTVSLVKTLFVFGIGLAIASLFIGSDAIFNNDVLAFNEDSNPVLIAYIQISTLLVSIAMFEYRVIVVPAQCIIQNKNLGDKRIVGLIPEHFYNETSDDDTEEHTSIKRSARFSNFFHYLFKHCWIGTYIGIWKPVINIKINLGFDDIEHSNIVYGLLKQLKVAYADKFVSIRSVRVVAIKLFIFFLLVVLSAKLGDRIFGFIIHSADSPRIERSVFTYEVEGVQKTLYAYQSGTMITPYLFGFQLYQSLPPDNADSKSKQMLFAKVTHPNKNAYCYGVDGNLVLLGMVNQIANGVSNQMHGQREQHPLNPSRQITSAVSHKCTNLNAKAYMTNHDLFFWLYLEVLSLPPRTLHLKEDINTQNSTEDNIRSQSLFYLVNKLTKTTIMPFQESYFELPVERTLNEQPHGVPNNAVWVSGINGVKLYNSCHSALKSK